MSDGISLRTIRGNSRGTGYAKLDSEDPDASNGAAMSSSSRAGKQAAHSRTKSKRKLARYTDDNGDEEEAALLSGALDGDLEAQQEDIPLATRPVRLAISPL